MKYGRPRFVSFYRHEDLASASLRPSWIEGTGARIAPATEARMAHSPLLGRSYSNPASRLAYERPWLVVAAALAIFAFYVISGNYSFTRPLTLNQPLDSEAAAGAGLIAETGSASFSADSGAFTESGITSTDDISPSADAPEAASAIAVAPQPATSEAAPPPAAEAPLTTATAAARWATAGIILVTDGQEWDEASLANVDAALSMLPPATLASLGNPELGPMHILVNAEGRAMSGAQPYGGAANYFSTNDGINELVLYPGQRVTTVLHELGHAYNLRSTPAGQYAQVLLDPEMERFLAATGWSIVTPRDVVATLVDHTKVVFDYEGSFRWPEVSHFDPLEDYANTFAAYYADPEGLRADSPERYAWMDANLPR
jgi:hypothetical protein